MKENNDSALFQSVEPNMIKERVAAFIVGIACLWMSEWFYEVAWDSQMLFPAVKIGVFIFSGWIAFGVFSRGIIGWAVFFSASCIIFNPIFRVEMPEDSWQVIDGVFGLIFLFSFFRLGRFSKLLARLQINEARAKAIDEAVERGDLDPEIIEHFHEKIYGADKGQNPK